MKMRRFGLGTFVKDDLYHAKMAVVYLRPKSGHLTQPCGARKRNVRSAFHLVRESK